jgi:4-hydroxy-L-threonine phosphate dehydrogenase PdxA
LASTNQNCCFRIESTFGDNGVIGKEEIEIIKPTIKKLFEKGTMVFGPFPADGFFGSNQYEKYDAIIATYHDQGLIPFKTLIFW